MKRLLGYCLLPLFFCATSMEANQLLILGDGSRGQTNVPIESSSILQISCGREHLVALRRDGSVSAWGYDGNGRATPPEIRKAIAVSAGAYHSLALLGNGTVVAWGVKDQGLTKVPASAINVIQVAAGSFHSLALRSDGTIVGWGYNADNRSVAPTNLSGVVSIAVGRDHSVALKKNGSVVCWGMNDEGQTSVPENLDRVTAIAAGDFHTLALKSDGTVLAWGNNQHGQSTVPAGLSGVVGVAAGHRHSVALKADGTVVAWGYNSVGQASIPTGIAGVVGVSAGGLNTALLSADAPFISQQPLSQTFLAGRDAVFNVTANGSGLSYKWYFNGVALVASSRIQGSSGARLSINDVQKSDAGVYAVDVIEGNKILRSANALLVVRSLLQLSAPVIADGIAKITFADEEGEVLSAPDAELYQLQWSSDLENWANLPGAITAVSGKLVATDEFTTGTRFYRLVPK